MTYFGSIIFLGCTFFLGWPPKISPTPQSSAVCACLFLAIFIRFAIFSGFLFAIVAAPNPLFRITENATFFFAIWFSHKTDAKFLWRQARHSAHLHTQTHTHTPIDITHTMKTHKKKTKIVGLVGGSDFSRCVSCFFHSSIFQVGCVYGVWCVLVCRVKKYQKIINALPHM